MKIRVIIKKLSNPRVRWRLKVGLSVWAAAILLGMAFKMTYDIGHFNAQTLKKDKNAGLAIGPPTLTIESAQRIVAGALREDPLNPKTVVTQVLDNNYKLSNILIDSNGLRKIAWIIDMRLFFIGDLFNDEGYNLTEGIEQQQNIPHSEH